MRARLILAVLLTALLTLAPPPPASAVAPRQAGEPPPALAAEFRYPSLFPRAPTVGRPAQHIEISLAQQQLVAYAGPAPVRAFDVSTGDAEHPTLIGRFTIQQKYARIDLVGRDYYYPAVPYVMLMIRPFYIHAAPWRAEFGLPLSRGCVTLATADAAWLYTWTEIGTPVNIHW